MKFDIICEKHPRYKAVRYPLSACPACVKLWFLKSGKRTIVDYNAKDGFSALVAK